MTDVNGKEKMEMKSLSFAKWKRMLYFLYSLVENILKSVSIKSSIQESKMMVAFYCS